MSQDFENLEVVAKREVCVKPPEIFMEASSCSLCSLSTTKLMTSHKVHSKQKAKQKKCALAVALMCVKK